MTEYNVSNSLFQSDKKKIDFKKIIRVLLIIIVFILSVYLLSIILFDYLFPNNGYPNIRIVKMLYAAIFLTVFLQSIGACMILYILFQVYRRTTYHGYLFEGVGFVIYLFISLIALPLIVFQPFNGMIYVFTQWVLIIQYPFLKKPLIWDSKYHRKIINPSISHKTDILLLQSLFIQGFQDGYSPRPSFIDYSDIRSKLPDHQNLDDKIILFVKFLSMNGDLVGYENNTKSNKIYLYLRTAFFQRSSIINPYGLYKKITKILRNKGLTTITFDLQTLEMSIKVSKDDYTGLDNITYHELVERILNQFKIGLEKFIEGKYVASYEQVIPVTDTSNSAEKLEDLFVFSLFGYLIGLVIIGPIYVYYAIIFRTDSLFFNMSYALGWPLVSFFGIEYVSGYLMGGSDSANYIQYFPIILLAHIVAILLLVIAIYLYRNLKIKKLKDPLKGLRIPIKILEN